MRKQIATLGIVFCTILSGCGRGEEPNQASSQPPRKSKSPSQFSETTLCPYRKDASGGFSPYWVAYIIDPAKDANDKSSFVELNGQRLGPYAQVSRMMEVSRDGKHIAFAAEKSGKMVVVVDGVEKFTHEGLLWPWCAWSPTLEGNSFVPQTQAAVLEFSPDGQSIAYPAKMTDGQYAVFVNGKPGPAFPVVGSSIGFVAGQVQYHAFLKDDKTVEVHGERLLGPYDGTFRTKVSPDGNHCCFGARIGDKRVLVVDGETRELPGELTSYVIGNGGFVAYAYRVSGKEKVRVGKVDLPGDYDEVAEMTPSPDSTKVAFWGRRGEEWKVVAGDKELPGFDGYFYYQCGGRKYSVMWSPDAEHIAYYARERSSGMLVLDGQKLEAPYKPPGFTLQRIVDDKRQVVGLGMMNGPQMDTDAFVQAVLLRNEIKCDPFSTTLFDRQLCYIEKGESDAFMHVGDKKEGPYKSVKSVLLVAPHGKHYAYFVQTDKGDQIVIDGTIAPQVYDAIYRPLFNEEDGALVALAVKDGNLVRVVKPPPAE
jgi:hypothetical protein